MPRPRLFAYPGAPHVRKHAPAGYVDHRSYKPWLRDEFRFRCVYCLERERWYPSGSAAFAVEHVRPKSNPRFAHLICDYDNLVYACSRCNSNKGRSTLLDPCAAALARHLRVTAHGKLIPLTRRGAYLIKKLGLNEPDARDTRRRYLRLLALYRRNPNDPDVRKLYLDAFGYPKNLPEFGPLRSPRVNTKPQGVRESHWRLRHADVLPEVYF